ncbi:MAG: hypothetical protein U5J62_03880 [Desulfurivibrio sp.]|nr:hypothetical protein [Desulfurivibrio sp.]
MMNQLAFTSLTRIHTAVDVIFSSIDNKAKKTRPELDGDLPLPNQPTTSWQPSASPPWAISGRHFAHVARREVPAYRGKKKTMALKLAEKNVVVVSTHSD